MIDQFLPRFLDIYSANMAEHTRLYDGMDDVLAGFEVARHRVGHGHQQARLARAAVDGTVASSTKRCARWSRATAFPVRKPDPAPVLHACEIAGVDVASSALRRRRPARHAAGRAAGALTIAAAWGYLDGDDPHSWGADRVVELPSDLPRALGAVVNAEPSNAPLASFEAKWADVHPEFGLALTFLREPARSERSAFGCLVFELEHAAFGHPRDAARGDQAAMVGRGIRARRARRGAASADESARRAHRSRVDSTRALAGSRHGGAESARSGARARSARADRNYTRFYSPLAEIETALFADSDAAATARAIALSRALRETAVLPDALRDGRLPLPLDLLARTVLRAAISPANRPKPPRRCATG